MHGRAIGHYDGLWGRGIKILDYGLKRNEQALGLGGILMNKEYTLA